MSAPRLLGLPCGLPAPAAAGRHPRPLTFGGCLAKVSYGSCEVVLQVTPASLAPAHMLSRAAVASTQSWHTRHLIHFIGLCVGV